jgi:helix-turn-helix protein
VSERRSQSARILALLERKPEVSSRDLSAISLQYCARIAELRDAGAVISNRVEVQRSGVRHGFYKLVYRPPIIERVSNHEPQRKPLSSAPGSLFPENESKAERFQYPD